MAEFQLYDQAVATAMGMRDAGAVAHAGGGGGHLSPQFNVGPPTPPLAPNFNVASWRGRLPRSQRREGSGVASSILIINIELRGEGGGAAAGGTTTTLNLGSGAT